MTMKNVPTPELDLDAHDHAEIVITDDHNDSKAHGWKRIGGQLFYAQYIDGRNFYAAFGGLPRSDGWHPADQAHGYYDYYLRAQEAVLEAGDEHEVDVNQGLRPAIVLAVSPDRGAALVEYEMPAGTTALATVRWYRDRSEAGRRREREHGLEYHGPRSTTYGALPKYWASLMHDQGTTDWQGRGQRRAGQWAAHCRKRGLYRDRYQSDCYPFPKP